MNEAQWDMSVELDAVNDIMSAIGESPVMTLAGDANIDVVNARRLLNKCNRQIQSAGYTFNIDEVDLLPDTYSSLIPYLPEYLSVTTEGGTVLSNRGGYVYDRENKTDIFTGPLSVTLKVLRPFEDMPVPFQIYIVAMASRMFNTRFFGAPELSADLERDEQIALMRVNEYELDYADLNMLSGDRFVSGAVGR